MMEKVATYAVASCSHNKASIATATLSLVPKYSQRHYTIRDGLNKKKPNFLLILTMT